MLIVAQGSTWQAMISHQTGQATTSDAAKIYLYPILSPGVKAPMVHRLIPIYLTTFAMITPVAAESYADDVALLKRHTEIITLRLPQGGARVAIAPAWQARVMTSSLAGETGSGFGWINPEAIKAGIVAEDKRSGIAQHIHLFGGEERFWLGPEGGQFALFFPHDAPAYEFEFWKTPALIDTEGFELESKSANFATFTKSGQIENKAGNLLKMKINRKISLVDRVGLENLLGHKLPEELRFVAFRSKNRVTNSGTKAWTRESGLPSIWILGMLKHSASSVVAIPIRPDATDPAVRSDYFGALDEQRLKETDRVVYFKADGEYRSKIGIPPSRATPYVGSYDPTTTTLTLVHYNLPKNPANFPYVKSQWEEHQKPYGGDVINAYNDGPTEPGGDPLGPFYELETSSPGLALDVGESYTHTQTTIHLQGAKTMLDKIARETLACSLEEIENAFE